MRRNIRNTYGKDKTSSKEIFFLNIFGSYNYLPIFALPKLTNGALVNRLRHLPFTEE